MFELIEIHPARFTELQRMYDSGCFHWKWERSTHWYRDQIDQISANKLHSSVPTNVLNKLINSWITEHFAELARSRRIEAHTHTDRRKDSAETRAQNISAKGAARGKDLHVCNWCMQRCSVDRQRSWFSWLKVDANTSHTHRNRQADTNRQPRSEKDPYAERF